MVSGMQSLFFLMELKYRAGSVTIDISKRYSIELNKIGKHWADLERGHIYELTKTLGILPCAILAQYLKK